MLCCVKRRSTSPSSTSASSARSTILPATHQSAPGRPADRYARVPGSWSCRGSRHRASTSPCPAPRAGPIPPHRRAQRRHTSATPRHRERQCPPVSQRWLPDAPARPVPGAARGTAARTVPRRPDLRSGPGRRPPRHGARCRSAVAGESARLRWKQSLTEYAGIRVSHWRNFVRQAQRLSDPVAEVGSRPMAPVDEPALRCPAVRPDSAADRYPWLCRQALPGWRGPQVLPSW